VFWINFTFYLLVKKVISDLLVGFFCFADKFALTTCKAKAMSSGIDIVSKGPKVSLVILISLWNRTFWKFKLWGFVIPCLNIFLDLFKDYVCLWWNITKECGFSHSKSNWSWHTLWFHSFQCIICDVYCGIYCIKITIWH
jgi:hypothetical protein